MHSFWQNAKNQKLDTFSVFGVSGPGTLDILRLNNFSLNFYVYRLVYLGKGNPNNNNNRNNNRNNNEPKFKFAWQLIAGRCENKSTKSQHISFHYDCLGTRIFFYGICGASLYAHVTELDNTCLQKNR